jgi:hypothetical protein
MACAGVELLKEHLFSLGVFAACGFVTTVYAQSTKPAAHKPVAFELLCPAFIETTQTIRGAVPSDWEAVDADTKRSPEALTRKHYLAGAGFSTGHPSELATLKPDNDESVRATRPYTLRWSFYGGERHYISCRYDDTTVEMTQALPEKTKQCRVHYQHRPVRRMQISCTR